MWKQLALLLAFGLASFCAQPVAVIAVFEGKATVTSAEHHSQPAHSVEWLSAGVVLEAAPGARLVLAFASGRRYELSSGGKVSITADGPVSLSGSLRELEKLPPMPKLPVINQSGAAAMGGMRVREMGSVHLLFSHANLSTLPEHTVLRFETDQAGTRYQVEVMDPVGSILHHSETATTTLNVPAGALRPGQSYVWRVRGMNGEVLGQATFRTATTETIAGRAAFKAAIAESDIDSRLLLTAMDAQLGLYEEARDELQSIPHSAQPEAVRRLHSVIEDAMR